MAQQTSVPYESKSVAEITQGAKSRLRVSRSLLTLVFVILAALYFIPFYWMFISALRNPDRIFADAGVFYPTALNFSNYLRLFQERPFLQWFGNSLILTIGFACVALVVVTMGGFALAHYRFPGRNLIFLSALGSTMVPFYLLLIPLFLIMVNTRLIDTYQGVILPLAATPFGLFFMRQYMSSISTELLDAARVDGASEYRIFWSIILPLSKPAMGAMLILFSLDMWNNLLWPLIVMRSDNHFPLAVGLASMVNVYNPEYDLLMAASVLATLPMLILFLLFQRQFITAMTATGLLVEK
jgi:ABC-type glycerol-3-phosphate transport system permease component